MFTDDFRKLSGIQFKSRKKYTNVCPNLVMIIHCVQDIFIPLSYVCHKLEIFQFHNAVPEQGLKKKKSDLL